MFLGLEQFYTLCRRESGIPRGKWLSPQLLLGETSASKQANHGG